MGGPCQAWHRETRWGQPVQAKKILGGVTSLPLPQQEVTALKTEETNPQVQTLRTLTEKEVTKAWTVTPRRLLICENRKSEARIIALTHKADRIPEVKLYAEALPACVYSQPIMSSPLLFVGSRHLSPPVTTVSATRVESASTCVAYHLCAY